MAVLKALVNGEYIPVEYKAKSEGLFIKCTAKPIRHEGLYGLLIDCGRKYYTVAEFKTIIDTLSEYGYNALWLHFSEEMGLRLESKKYPWLAGSDDSLCIEQGITDTDEGRYLTQEDMSEVVAYAFANGIEIIPSFDSPGHMNYIVKKYNEHYSTDIGNYYHYNGQTLIVQGSGNTSYSRGIDISNPTAVDFVKNLITEYAIFFHTLGCTKFDIGGDELLGWGARIDSSKPRWQQLDHWKAKAISDTGNNNAVAYDCFLAYMNDIKALVEGIGYEYALMWNDDALRDYDTMWTGVVKLDKDIVIEYWTNDANNSKNTPEIYMSEGHRIINMVNTYNYYVLKTDATNPTVDNLLEWTKETISNTKILDEYEGKNIGSAFCVWADNPSIKAVSEYIEDVFNLLYARKFHVNPVEPSRELVYSEDFIEADIGANTDIGASDWTNIVGRYYTYEFEYEITNNVGSNNSLRATNAMTNFMTFSKNVSRTSATKTFIAAGSKRSGRPFACRVGTSGNSYHIKIWNLKIYQEPEDYAPFMLLASDEP